MFITLMSRSCFIVLLFTLFSFSSAADKNVLDIKKMVQGHNISPKYFHELNVGHLIYNYYSTRVNEKGHLKNFHNLQYTGTVSFGDPDQPMNVILDLGTADTMILAKTHCTFPLRLFSSVCWTHTQFDETLSYKGNKASFLWSDAMFPAFHLTYGKSSVQGFLMYDRMKIKKIVVPQALLGLIQHWENSFSYSVADGIVGIGRRGQSNFASGKCLSHVSSSDVKRIADHLTFMDSLKSQGVSTIGFHLYKDKKGNDVGQLVLGSAENENKRYTGEIRWYGQTQFQSVFWRIPLSKLKFVDISDGEISELQLTGGYPIPDPGTSLIAGPPAVIDQINERLFKGMKLPKTEKKYGSLEFDCRYQDQLPMVVFMIDGRGFILEAKDYVKRFGNTCTSGFMAVEKLPMVVVGDTFLRKFYAVFDYASDKVGLAQSIPPKMS